MGGSGHLWKWPEGLAGGAGRRPGAGSGQRASCVPRGPALALSGDEGFYGNGGTTALLRSGPKREGLTLRAAAEATLDPDSGTPIPASPSRCLRTLTHPRGRAEGPGPGHSSRDPALSTAARHRTLPRIGVCHVAGPKPVPRAHCPTAGEGGRPPRRRATAASRAGKCTSIRRKSFPARKPPARGPAVTE